MIISLALAIGDLAAMYAAFIAAYQLRALSDKPFLNYVALPEYATISAALVPAWITIFAICGLYSMRQTRGWISELMRVAAAVGIGVALLIVVDYLVFDVQIFPARSVPFYAYLLGVVLVVVVRPLVRLALQQLYARGRALHSIVIVGTGPVAERVATGLLRSLHGNQIVAAVDRDNAGGRFLGNLPVYGAIEQALDAHRIRVDEIVHAEPSMDRSETERIMRLAIARDLGYRFVPDAYGVFTAASTMGTIRGLPVMEVRLTSLGGWGAVGKRALDILGSVVGLFLLAPLFGVLAAIVKLTDPAGPVFYAQERVGRGGRPIRVLKFRSMQWEYSTGPDRPYKTAEEAFTAMGRPDLVAEFAVDHKVADDPRVSAFGSFMRRTSLDELPQLLNALRGDLSLVGPRPVTYAELSRYGDRQASFLALKPGITGLWQVSGRSDTTYDERVQLDVYYAENWSTTLDFSILARTVVTVAARRGAY
ncbi:MAG: sugar transferase [Microlunatus sp.]